jgi:hypothetical protein
MHWATQHYVPVYSIFKQTIFSSSFTSINIDRYIHWLNLSCECCVIYLLPVLVVPSNDQATSQIWPLWYRVSLLSYPCAWSIDTEIQHLPGHPMTADMLVVTLSWTAYSGKSKVARRDFVLSCWALRVWDHVQWTRDAEACTSWTAGLNTFSRVHM